MNSASVSIWMFWSRSRRRPGATGDPAAWRWRPRAGRRHRATARTPSAAATMDDLDTPFLAASSIQALGVLGLDEQVQAVLADRSIPSLGSREASRAVRCMAGSSWPGSGSGRSSSSSSARSAGGRVQLGVVGDGFGEFGLTAWAAVIGAAQAISGCRGRCRRNGRDRQVAPVVGPRWRRIGIAPGR